MSSSLESLDCDKPNSKNEGDEAIISMSVAGEVTDTSIMEIGRSRPQFQYSREELMVIKSLPLSKRRPALLDSVYNNSRGVWDPERWHSDRKRSETPPKEERTGRSEQIPENHAKRRNGDPRERIRKEQDGIVLSPQRRSFNSGCFVNTSQPNARRPESPIGKTEIPHREPVRRIGSGRILTRDIWDFRSESEKLDPDRLEFSFRPTSTGISSLRETKEREDRFERRSFSRDFGSVRDRKFNERRRTFSEDEPEWFISGPTSQHDTIELRGFEDIPEEKALNNGNSKKKQVVGQKKRGKKREEREGEREGVGGPKGRSTPTADQPLSVLPVHSPIADGPEGVAGLPGVVSGRPVNFDSAETEKSEICENSEENVALEEGGRRLERGEGKELGKGNEVVENTTADVSASALQPERRLEERPAPGKIVEGKQEGARNEDFNLDEFLKSDTFPGVPGLLTNGVGSNGGTGSRFSQWFKRESPIAELDSRRTSIQDELLNNLLNDITEPHIQIPSVTESNAYFAPISPANTTNNATTPAATAGGVKLLEMLQRGNKTAGINQNGQGDGGSGMVTMMKSTSIKDMEVGGKVVHSLEELEARMRGGAPPPAPSNEQPRVNKTEEDLTAFKKLLAQVTGGQAVPAANGPISQKIQPVTLMQLLNSQLKPPQPITSQPPMTEQIHPTFNHVGPLGPTQHAHQAQMQHENLMKVLQIQQQQQQQQQQKQRHPDMLSMMMGGQRMLGVSPVPPEMQIMLNNAPSSQELLQRPEAQAIIQGLQQGEITRQHLIQQLQNPAMQHRHREVLMNILKMYGGSTPRTISPHPNAPTHQDHMLQQMLYQQQQRIPSPMNNAYYPPTIISPNLATSPNTLSVQHPVMTHRVPSPRELAMHTQSIMQNALIKKKLEEQRENFRKRQDQQQSQQSQRSASPVNSPAKQTMSPTPLAFTPTSVLRKMTAEKEAEGTNNDPPKLSGQSQSSQMQQMQSAVQLLAQGVLSRHNTLLPAQSTVQSTWTNPTIKQHPGRPIVKGGSQFQYTPSTEFQQAPALAPSQQQRTITNVYTSNQARSKHTMATSLPNVPQFNVAQNSIINQRPNLSNQIKVQSHLVNLQQQQQQQQRSMVNNQVVVNQNYNSSRSDARVMRAQHLNMPVTRQPVASQNLSYVGMNSSSNVGGNGNDNISSSGSSASDVHQQQSSTMNQLARWFSPELLAQARAGKLPELGQTNVLSLEELERLQHASTTVHN